jgi:hypothetical protein
MSTCGSLLGRKDYVFLEGHYSRRRRNRFSGGVVVCEGYFRLQKRIQRETLGLWWHPTCCTTRDNRCLKPLFFRVLQIAWDSRNRGLSDGLRICVCLSQRN